MRQQIDLRLGKNHVGGGFEWSTEPICSCGKVKEAVDEGKYLFVSNFTEADYNIFYMMPLAADGTLARNQGVEISHCPWCGDQIKGQKKYATRSA